MHKYTYVIRSKKTSAILMVNDDPDEIFPFAENGDISLESLSQVTKEIRKIKKEKRHEQNN